MVIRQTPDEAKASFEFHMHAELVGMRLAEAKLRSIPFDSSLVEDGLETRVSFAPKTSIRTDNSIIFRVDFQFLVVGGSKATKLISIGPSLEAEYRLSAGFAPSEQQTEAFHKGNVVFNCWPFFREFVQNSAVRMNYPAPPVPFLRLLPKTGGSKDN